FILVLLQTLRLYPLSLHDALPISLDKIDRQVVAFKEKVTHRRQPVSPVRVPPRPPAPARTEEPERLRMKLRPMSQAEAVSELQADRKSTRLNSSHVEISYAVFCLK